MFSKIKSLTVAEWIFIVIFDLVVFTLGYNKGHTQGVKDEFDRI